MVTIDRRAHNKLQAADRDALVSKLAATFTEFGTLTKTDAIEKRLADLQYDDLQPVPVATDISQDLMVYLAEHADEFPNVGVERESVRDYKVKDAGGAVVGGNILGYVGRITKEKLDAAEPGTDPEGVVKEYQPDSTIGLAGIEAAYEKDLRGTPGHRGARDRRQEPPGGPPVVPGAPARQRHPAQHRHQRADEGRGGPARAAQRGARRQPARQLRRPSQERAGRRRRS